MSSVAQIGVRKGKLLRFSVCRLYRERGIVSLAISISLSSATLPPFQLRLGRTRPIQSTMPPAENRAWRVASPRRARPPGNPPARRKFAGERRIIHLINPDATGPARNNIALIIDAGDARMRVGTGRRCWSTDLAPLRQTRWCADRKTFGPPPIRYSVERSTDASALRWIERYAVIRYPQRSAGRERSRTPRPLKTIQNLK